jgi:DNA-binding transcriptional regulator YdaS (Cro superfamily)
VKQTHKFKALADVAAIVASSATVTAASRRLGVSPSSVHRWIKAGKVPRRAGRAITAAAPATARQTPTSWARAVRRTYVLDATEQTLVDLAKRALELSRDATAKVEQQLQAMGRYQALVRQLKLEDPAHGEIETPADASGRFPRRAG